MLKISQLNQRPASALEVWPSKLKQDQCANTCWCLLWSACGSSIAKCLCYHPWKWSGDVIINEAEDNDKVSRRSRTNCSVRCLNSVPRIEELSDRSRTSHPWARQWSKWGVNQQRPNCVEKNKTLKHPAFPLDRLCEHGWAEGGACEDWRHSGRPLDQAFAGWAVHQVESKAVRIESMEMRVECSSEEGVGRWRVVIASVASVALFLIHNIY